MKRNNKKRMKEAKKHVQGDGEHGRETPLPLTRAMEVKMIAQIRKTREELWREKIGLGCGMGKRRCPHYGKSALFKPAKNPAF